MYYVYCKIAWLTCEYSYLFKILPLRNVHAFGKKKSYLGLDPLIYTNICRFKQFICTLEGKLHQALQMLEIAYFACPVALLFVYHFRVHKVIASLSVHLISQRNDNP